MNRVLNIGNMTNKNSYNIYISLGKRSIKYIAKIRKLLVICNKKQRLFYIKEIKSYDNQSFFMYLVKDIYFITICISVY